MLVKIAPDLSDGAMGELLEVCSDRGIAGVIATNTTVDRRGVTARETALAAEVGGLSGRPLAQRAREVVRFVTSHSDLPVIGVGGIASADDGLAMLDAGASLLQLYTGFIYAGPPLVRDLEPGDRRSGRGRPGGSQPGLRAWRHVRTGRSGPGWSPRSTSVVRCAWASIRIRGLLQAWGLPTRSAGWSGSR